MQKSSIMCQCMRPRHYCNAAKPLPKPRTPSYICHRKRRAIAPKKDDRISKMTRLMDMELATDSRATMPASVASVDGFARIAAFGRSLVTRWRHAARKHQVLQE